MIHDQPISTVCLDSGAAGPTGHTGTPRRVLLVSEDPLMLRTLSRLLRQAGYEIVQRDLEAGRGGPAEPRRPNLVIIDVPDDWSRSANGGVYHPVGDLDAPRILWIGDAGSAALDPSRHLTKPFTGGQLLAKIESLLGNEQSEEGRMSELPNGSF